MLENSGILAKSEGGEEVLKSVDLNRSWGFKSPSGHHAQLRYVVQYMVLNERLIGGVPDGFRRNHLTWVQFQVHRASYLLSVR